MVGRPLVFFISLATHHLLPVRPTGHHLSIRPPPHQAPDRFFWARKDWEIPELYFRIRGIYIPLPIHGTDVFCYINVCVYFSVNVAKYNCPIYP